MKDDRVQNFLIMAVICIAAAGLAVYSWIVLPDMVATQPAAFSTGAPAVHKLFAIGLSTALMVMFGYLGSRERKLYLGSLIGVALHVLFWVTN